MKYLQNEKGASIFYLLSLLGTVFLIMVIVVNLVKVYIVKEQANTAVEQAAIAGTSVLLEESKEAIKDFDQNPLSIVQKVADGGKSVSQLVQEKADDYQHLPESDAYIKALNEILPMRIDLYPPLKDEFQMRFYHTDIATLVSPVVSDMISENSSNADDMEIDFSTEYWRLEVKSSSTFESISDGKIMAAFSKDVPQKGYGPSLDYMENVFQ